MKIGLLTYHAACNFGANLQALSTLCFWRNKGYEPIFINWMTEELESNYKRSTPPVQFDEHRRFRETYFPMTRRCWNDEDVASVIRDEEIDAVVVGSDAVMQTKPKRSRYAFPTRRIIAVSHPTADTVCPNPFWGSYYHLLSQKIPLCYMSASSQNSPYRSSNCREKRLQCEMLSQYSYISTRDDWTSKQVAWLTNDKIIPPVTPDPVFAFNHNVLQQPTEQEIREKYGLQGKYCLFCFHNDRTVSQEWLIEMQNRMDNRGVQCVAFPFPQGVEFHHPFKKQIDLPLSPIDWYALIKYADFYIGANMHPIVICLHNSVPCFCFDHYGIKKMKLFINKRSSKIYHIMDRFEVLDNRVSIEGRYKQPSVDYVLEKLDSFDKEKVRSIADLFLNDYLKMMKDIEYVITNY